MQELIARLEDALGPIVAAQGCDLWDIEIAGRGRSMTVRIIIDRRGGVSVEDCAAVSRQVDVALDAEDIIEGPYTLEVSSPGLTRKLKTPRDFTRAVGRLARVTVRGSARGGKSGKLEGRIKRAGERGIALALAPDGAEVEIDYRDIAKANLEIE